MSESERFCKKCGSRLSEGATFCTKCGAQVVPPAISALPVPPPPADYRREKREKSEKAEKTEKSEKYEKGSDRTGALVGGLVLIWLGLTFVMVETGTLSWVRWWTVFLAGLGVIIIIQGLIRYLETRYIQHLTGSLIGGALLIFISMAFLTNVSGFWYIFLILLGLAIIISSIFARSRAPRP